MISITLFQVWTTMTLIALITVPYAYVVVYLLSSAVYRAKRRHVQLMFAQMKPVTKTDKDWGNKNG